MRLTLARLVDHPYVRNLCAHILSLFCQIFAELWGSDALLSSFDSINALPATQTPPAESWLHVDQAPHRRGAACIQGLVNLVDVGPETTGTLLVKDCSHSAHQTFFEEASQVRTGGCRIGWTLYLLWRSEIVSS